LAGKPITVVKPVKLLDIDEQHLCEACFRELYYHFPVTPTGLGNPHAASPYGEGLYEGWIPTTDPFPVRCRRHGRRLVQAGERILVRPMEGVPVDSLHRGDVSPSHIATLTTGTPASMCRVAKVCRKLCSFREAGRPSFLRSLLNRWRSAGPHHGTRLGPRPRCVARGFSRRVRLTEVVFGR
jgi:hypothetical protein